MKKTNESEPIDWRARLHSLPSGTEPASPFVRRLLRAFLGFCLFLVGSLFVIVSGAFVGLSRGIGPEQTGGAIYILLGLLLNVVVGAILAALTPRPIGFHSLPRLVFYSFTSPAFLGVTFLSIFYLAHVFR